MSMSADKQPAFARKGDYGIDAPFVPLFLGLGGLLLLLLTIADATGRAPIVWTLVSLLCSLWLLGSAAIYLHTTRSGKFAVWDEILRGVHLRGDEQVLDLGCGRGAVLLAVARLLPRGRAVGIDLWKTVDQSGNSIAVTQRNAALEGVADRVELRTGDMRELPFPDGTFDLVVSSLAIHNIPSASGRAKAIDEAVRVLKPGGRLLIADIRAIDEYRERLRQLGLHEIAVQSPGWRFWYGGPWMATRLVSAVKPADVAASAGAVVTS